MATSWLKFLQCKSNALEDVYAPSSKHLTHLLPSSSCTKSVQSLKDVIETNTNNKKTKKPSSSTTKPTSRYNSNSKCSKSKSNNPDSNSVTRVRPSTSRPSDPVLSTLTKLPEHHPSHNVVQIIFHTSWSDSHSTGSPFSGRVEMIFKVHNPPKTVSRFEEYRELVKSRAVSGKKDDDGRCVADGNEVMRFYSVGPTAGAIYDLGRLCEFGKNRTICTFSGSGMAHESLGGGKGARGMMVCRVVAGRVCKRLGVESFLGGRVGFDSVGGDNGELFVFDSRALLPCFLIIYRP